MRRGQITIFFMIGVVLLILVLFIIQVLNIDAPQENKSNLITAEQYVASCIDQGFYDMMDVLGEQGGYTGSGEAGTGEHVSLIINGNDYDVAVAINGTGAYSEPPNSLPDGVNEVGFYDYATSSGFLTPYFGLLKMPPLCDINGPNRMNNGEYPVCIGSYGSSSIQKDLQENLQEEVETCLNEDINTLDIDTNSLGEPKIELILFNNNIKIVVDYPDADIEPLPHFEKSYDIPLYDMYFFIREQLINNLKNPEVNIIANPRGNTHYLPGFSFQKNTLASTRENHVYELLALNHKYRGTTAHWRVVITDRPKYSDCAFYGSHNIDPDDANNLGCTP